MERSRPYLLSRNDTVCNNFMKIFNEEFFDFI